MNSHTYQEGLTLIEVMIAVSLFMVLMVAVSSSIPTLFKLNNNTTTTQEMSVYAKNVIDQTRGFWLTPTSSGSSEVDHYGNLTAGTLPTPLPEVPSNLSCVTPPVVVETARILSPASTSTSAAYWTTRRKITVSCRPVGNSSAAYTDFVAEIGRPE